MFQNFDYIYLDRQFDWIWRFIGPAVCGENFDLEIDLKTSKYFKLYTKIKTNGWWLLELRFSWTHRLAFSTGQCLGTFSPILK